MEEGYLSEYAVSRDDEDVRGTISDSGGAKRPYIPYINKS